MKDNLRIICTTDSDRTFEVTDELIKETGRQGKCTGKEDSLGKTIATMRGAMKRTTSMVLGSSVL